MRVRWSDAARAELLEIFAHVARFDTDAARRVRAALRAAVDDLRAHPMIGRVVPELELAEVRERVVGRYRVMYLLRGHEIVVVAVVHGRQVAGSGAEP